MKTRKQKPQRQFVKKTQRQRAQRQRIRPTKKRVKKTKMKGG